MLGSFQFSGSALIADRSENYCSRNACIFTDDAFWQQVN